MNHCRKNLLNRNMHKLHNQCGFHNGMFIVLCKSFCCQVLVLRGCYNVFSAYEVSQQGLTAPLQLACTRHTHIANLIMHIRGLQVSYKVTATLTEAYFRSEMQVYKTLLSPKLVHVTECYTDTYPSCMSSLVKLASSSPSS